MSSWGLILALSGYFCNAAQGLLQFAPKLRAEDFRCIWSSGTAWGVFAQTLSAGCAEVMLEVLGGSQALHRLRLRPGKVGDKASAVLPGGGTGCTTAKDGERLDVVFAPTLRLTAGETLTVTLTA